MSQFRNVCVTFNNYPKDFCPKVFEQHCKYFVIGKEIGKSGTPHLQCYLEFKMPYRLKKIQALFKSKVHIERRKGKALQAADYCKKEQDFYEFGQISQQGKRNDIASLREAVKAGKSIVSLYDEHDAMWKYHRAAKDFRLHLDMSDKKFTVMEVICYYGPAGSGKTGRAHEMDPNIYRLASTKPLWFDGYSGQATLLIDDFYGNMDYSTLLQLLDGYRFSVPIKGGFVWKKWSRVIITSNTHPKTWYVEHDFSALERRFTKILEVGCSITPTSVTT